MDRLFLSLFLGFVCLWGTGIQAQSIFTDSDWEKTPYSPSNTVKRMHNVPRVTGVNDFDLDDEDYVAGVIMIAVIFFLAVSAILFIIFGITCARVCKCCGLERKQERISSHKWHISGIVSGALVIFGLVITLVGASLMISAVINTTRDIDEIIDIVGTGVDELEAVLEEFPSSDEVNQTLIDLGFDNITVEYKNETLPLSDGLTLFYEDVFLAIDKVIAGFNDIIDELHETLNSIRRIVLGQGKEIPKICGVISFLLVFILLVGFVVLFFLLLGAEFALSAFVSDYCMGPDKNTANLFSGTAQDIVIFYINCELSDDITNELEDALQDLEDAIDSLEGLLDSDQIQALKDLVNEIRDLIEEVLAIIAQYFFCPEINALYASFAYDELCSTLVNGSVVGWSGLVVVVFFVVPLYVIYDQLMGVKGNLQKE